MEAVLLGGGPVDPALRRARPRPRASGWWRPTARRRPAGGCVYDGYALDGVGAGPRRRDGRIRIAGPTLFDGYDGDPAATAEVLVDGWFLTSDAGRLDEDGRLHVLGRIDDMVVSGGVNVPAPAVAARLREHPRGGRRRGASAWPTTSGATGSSRSWSSALDLDLDEARAWVGRGAPAVAGRRARSSCVDALPLLPNGKVDRLGAAAQRGRGSAR